MRIVPLLVLSVLLATAASAQTRRHVLNLSIDTYGEYDSNLQGTSNSDPGFRYSVAPRMALSADYGRLDYQTSYTPRFIGDTLNNAGERNRFTHQFTVGGGWGISQRTRVSLMNNLRNIENYGFTQLADEQRTGGSSHDWQNDLTLGIGQTLTPNFGLSAQAYYAIREREDPRYYDARYVGANVSARYKMDDNDSFSFGANYSRNEFIPPEDPTEQSDSGSVNHVTRGFVQWAHRFSRTLQLNLRVGPTVVFQATNQPLTEFPNSHIVPVDRPGNPKSFFSVNSEQLIQWGPGQNMDVREPDPQDAEYEQDVPFIAVGLPEGPFRTYQAAPLIYSTSLEDCQIETIDGFDYRRFDTCQIQTRADESIVLSSGLFDGVNPLYAEIDTPFGVKRSDDFLLHDYTYALITNQTTDYPWIPVQNCPGFTLCPIWRAEGFNVSSDPLNQPGVIPGDQPFTLGTLTYIGPEPTAKEDTLFRVSIEANLAKNWERWRLAMNYLRDEQPDANGGAGVSVDRIALNSRWLASRYWTVSGHFSWRYRRSNTRTRENVVVAGALRYPDGSIAYGQTIDDFNAQPDGQEILFRGSDPGDDSLSTPVAVGVVLGQKRNSVDVHTLGLTFAANRKLTQYSSITARVDYRYQLSEGRYYQTFDRWAVAIAFNFDLDPIRF